MAEPKVKPEIRAIRFTDDAAKAEVIEAFKALYPMKGDPVTMTDEENDEFVLLQVKNFMLDVLTRHREGKVRKQIELETSKVDPIE